MGNSQRKIKKEGKIRNNLSLKRPRNSKYLKRRKQLLNNNGHRILESICLNSITSKILQLDSLMKLQLGEQVFKINGKLNPYRLSNYLMRTQMVLIHFTLRVRIGNSSRKMINQIIGAISLTLRTLKTLMITNSHQDNTVKAISLKLCLRNSMRYPQNIDLKSCTSYVKTNQTKKLQNSCKKFKLYNKLSPLNLKTKKDYLLK